MITKKTITGTIILAKSKNPSGKCSCCNTKDGSHVYGIDVDWDDHFKKSPGLEKYKADEGDLVRELVRANNFDEVEGKKVRLTIEIIE